MPINLPLAAIMLRSFKFQSLSLNTKIMARLFFSRKSSKFSISMGTKRLIWSVTSYEFLFFPQKKIGTNCNCSTNSICVNQLIRKTSLESLKMVRRRKREQLPKTLSRKENRCTFFTEPNQSIKICYACKNTSRLGDF